MVMNFPPVPKEVKCLNHFVKLAAEHEERNIVVAYWSLMYAMQVAIKENPGPKSPELSRLLMAIMDWLEATKNANKDADGISSETTACAMIEEYILKLFKYAEQEENNEQYHKNMIKAFYNAALICDILQQFQPLTKEFEDLRKFAKWRATHIHACLKVGETPIPPNTIIHSSKEDEELNGFTEEAKEEDPEVDALGLTNIPGVPAESPSLEPEPSISTAPAPLPYVAPQLVAVNTNPPTVGPGQIEKAQKYCKWASSALNYDDVKTAVDNLQKALQLLTTGTDN